MTQTAREVIFDVLNYSLSEPHARAVRDDIIAALSRAGLVVVPREPTRIMKTAAEEALYNQYQLHQEWDEAKDVVENLDERIIYRAMIEAAAPQPQPETEK